MTNQIPQEVIERIAKKHGLIDEKGHQEVLEAGEDPLIGITTFANALLAHVQDGNEPVGYLDINDETGVAIDLIFENCDGLKQGQAVYTSPPTDSTEIARLQGEVERLGALLDSSRRAMKHNNKVHEHTDWSLLIKAIDETIGDDND